MNEMGFYSKIENLIKEENWTEDDIMGFCRYMIENHIHPKTDEQKNRLGDMDDRFTEYMIYFLQGN